eukprot:TRINITY_DN25662_c0_g1_i1.p1 TRINITY_DN25662_c0_g1~~TRINITY_DN25662_c0_g1_i1.p1  ORF type:complete len:902 (+),score=87.36 TRINITY_DN25662_c0_g1_i1:276-2708(+)
MDAPIAAGFSAERAREVVVDLSACGLKYIGSHANEVCAVDAVLKHVRGAVSDAGQIEIDVQSASGHFFIDFLGGVTNVYRNLTNIVVRLRGRPNGESGQSKEKCALLVSSHFDSAIGSPAASDANAEIAIMVELLRLLAHKPPPMDVIFNFNGGEEVLMAAAHGFITGHPWATDICAVVNLESTGSGGREVLFQAGPQNRWIVDAYARNVKRPHASSIIQLVFQTGLIPGDTDYRIYRDFGGLPGADFAVTDNDWVYHTSQDNLQHMDFRSVQRYGETAFELVNGMLQTLSRGRPVGAQAQEVLVYFDIAGAVLVSYSASMAQQVHIAGSIVLATWALRRRPTSVLIFVFKLLVCFVCSIILALLSGLVLAFSPLSLVGSGHPEVAFLLFAPPAANGFLHIFFMFFKDKSREEEIAAASIVIASSVCIGQSLSPVGILASYIPFAFAAFPGVAGAISTLCPSGIGCCVTVCGFLLPWLLVSQLSVLGFDLLCPLTMRSGTSIPGDALLAGFVGILVALFMLCSARFLIRLPQKGTHRCLCGTLLLGFCLASSLFPYSSDRPKRVFHVDVARSKFVWDYRQTPFESPQQSMMDSGLWTVTMDWNGVATFQKHAAFGFLPGTVIHNDSIGLYGEMPHPFPLRYMIGGGAWTPGPPPELPNNLVVDIALARSENAGSKEVHISVSGGPHVMLAVGPRSMIRRWSFGHFAETSLGMTTSQRPGDDMLPYGLPLARSDCDCFFLTFHEGGADPTQGRVEAFNFTIETNQGLLLMETSAAHMETTSPRLQAQQARMPHWASSAGWVSELQVHEIYL